MKTAILFDLDGTLLDTLEDLKDAVNHTLAQYGCPPRSRQEIRQFLGNGAARLIELSLPGQADDPELGEVLAAYQVYYGKHSQEKTGPYPGILEALEALGKQYKIGVVSNKPDIAVKPLCKAYFGEVYALGENAGCPRKPAPDMLYKAMGELGAEACIYVGDSEVDVLTARNAGVPCISVLWGFRDRACIEQAGGAHFCTHPAQLVTMIEEILHGK